MRYSYDPGVVSVEVTTETELAEGERVIRHTTEPLMGFIVRDNRRAVDVATVIHRDDAELITDALNKMRAG